jgi:integrase/recombinase XerD
MQQKTIRKLKRNLNQSQSPTTQGLNKLSLDDLIEKFMKFKKTEALAPRTIQDYYTNFQYLKNYLGRDILCEEFTTELFREYIGYMLHDMNLSPVTANIRIRTIRAFIRFCFVEGYIDTPIHDHFKPVKTLQDTLESFTPDEIKKLLSVIDEDLYTGYRDKIIVLILLDTMVRIAELVAIKRINVDLKAGLIQLEAEDTKTRRFRTVPLSSKTIKLLKDYMKETEDFDNEHLFLTYEGKKIAPSTIRIKLTEYGRIAGITNKRVSPHTFRHTGALYYILNGGDPFSLQKILGHSDMSMVRKYVQMSDTDVKRQHNTFSPLNNIFSN